MFSQTDLKAEIAFCGEEESKRQQYAIFKKRCILKEMKSIRMEKI